MKKTCLALTILLLSLTLPSEFFCRSPTLDDSDMGVAPDMPQEESYTEGGKEHMGLEDDYQEDRDRPRDILANQENEALAKSLANQYFGNPTTTWTKYQFLPVAIQFFVRDSWDHFQSIQRRFEEDKNKLKDWELGSMATAHVLKKYMDYLWGEKEHLTSKEMIPLLDMEKFDTWAETLDDQLMEELMKFVPEIYGSRPPEPEDHGDKESQWLSSREEAEDDSEVHQEMPIDWDVKNFEQNADTKWIDEAYGDL